MKADYLKKLREIFFSCNLGISYDPISDETNPLSHPIINEAIKKAPSIVIIPNNSANSPVNFAMGIKPDFQKTAFILIPGQCFDKKGTRRGRGNGWYDRFLSRVPKGWIRIGVTDRKHFSPSPLTRKSWDEPMDWVICENNGMWQLYETRARTDALTRIFRSNVIKDRQ